jgi:hypothetical protein
LLAERTTVSAAALADTRTAIAIAPLTRTRISWRVTMAISDRNAARDPVLE